MFISIHQYCGSSCNIINANSKTFWAIGLLFLCKFLWANLIHCQEQAPPPVRVDIVPGVIINKTDEKKAEETKTEQQPANKKKEEKPAADNAKQNTKKEGANPVANIIKGIFGGVKGKFGPVGEEPNDPENETANGDTSARDEIDEKAPFNRELSTQLISARKLAKLGNWKNAIPILQKIFDNQENSTLRNEEDHYQSIRWLAVELLNTAPEDVLAEYSREYSTIADKLLEEANLSGELDDVAKVANQYFHTPAGQKAACRLSLVHADRGELAMSYVWLQRLEQAKATITRQAEWREFNDKLTQAIKLEARKTPTRKPADNETNLPVSVDAIPPEADTASHKHSPYETILNSLNNSKRLINDWYYAFGNVSRNGVVQGHQPLLIKRWESEMARDFKVQNYINTFLEEIRLNEVTAIPAQTLVKSGKTVVVKSQHGIMAIHIDTGDILWEAETKFSPEQILSGQPIKLSPAFPKMILKTQGNWGGFNLSSSLEARPAGQLFFCDANYGQLSSNGQLVFAVNDLVHIAPYEESYSWGWGGENSLSKQDPLGRDWNVNKLVAYDLNTGTIRWMVGGEKRQEKFDLTLAGTYFFGPPLPHGRLLYVIGETDGEIKLLALNANSGELEWSLIIGYADLKIEVDALRRFYASPITIAQGLLLCTTHDGWVSAIDPLSRDIIWCERYEPIKAKVTRSHRNYYNRFNYKNFTQSWLSQPTQVNGYTALFFPNDSGEMVAFNLVTGKELWRKKKENTLYTAGTFENYFLLVNEKSLEAIYADTGKSAWTVKYPAEATKVSGFSQLASNFLLIPFFDGRILNIDLSTPQHHISWSSPAEGGIHLGNIFFADNSVISVSPAGITAFEQLEPTLNVVAERMKNNKHDVWSLLTKTRIALLNNDYPLAISSLEIIDPKLCLRDDLTNYKNLLWESLYGITRSDLIKHEIYFKQLETLADSPLRTRQLEFLRAERLIAANNLFEAHQVLINILKPGNKELIPDFFDKYLEVSLPIYVSSRLEHIWANASEEMKERLTAEISLKFSPEIRQADLKLQTYWLDVFRFHPLADEFTLDLIHMAFNKKDYATFDYFAHRIDQKYVDNIQLMRAELLIHYNLIPDARQVCDRLYQNFFSTLNHESPSKSSENTKTSLNIQMDEAIFREYFQSKNPEWLTRWDQLQTQLKSQDNAAYAKWSPSWKTDQLTVKHLGDDHYNNDSEIQLREIINPDTPFMQNHFHGYNSRSRTLSFNNLLNENVAHFSLRHANGNGANTGQTFYHRDHLLVCISHGILQLVSIPDKKTVWSQPLELKGVNTNYVRSSIVGNLPAMIKLRDITNQAKYTETADAMGALAGVTPGVIYTHGHKEIVAVDALSGEVRWKRKHLLDVSEVGGDNLLTFIIDSQADRSLCVDTFSGKKRAVETKKLINHQANLYRIIGRDLVLMKIIPGSQIPLLGETKSMVMIHRYDIINDQIIWEHKHDQNSYGLKLTCDEFVTLNSQGKVDLLDLKTGITTPYGTLNITDGLKFTKEIFMIKGPEEIFIMYNKNSNNNSYYYSGLRTARLNGELICLKPHLKEAVWKQKVENGMIVLNDFLQAPYIASIKMKYVSEDQIYYQEMIIQMFDKQTGAKLLDEKIITQDSLQKSRLSLKNIYWEFGTYNMRFRVTPVLSKNQISKVTTENDSPQNSATSQGAKLINTD